MIKLYEERFRTDPCIEYILQAKVQSANTSQSAGRPIWAVNSITACPPYLAAVKTHLSTILYPNSAGEVDFR
jgi:hypothetical protein